MCNPSWQWKTPITLVPHATKNCSGTTWEMWQNRWGGHLVSKSPHSKSDSNIGHAWKVKIHLVVGHATFSEKTLGCLVKRWYSFDECWPCCFTMWYYSKYKAWLIPKKKKKIYAKNLWQWMSELSLSPQAWTCNRSFHYTTTLEPGDS